MTPEKLSDAMDRLAILDNAQHGYSDGNATYVAPTMWFVVDESKAEPEVNWPGQLISEHTSRVDAKIGLAKALIDMANTGAHDADHRRDGGARSTGDPRMRR